MNPLPPLPLIDGQLYIDNSGWVEGMSSCYRYLQYRSLNLRIPSAEKPALNFGSVLHMIEEFRYLKYGNTQVPDDFLNQISPLLTDFFAEHPPVADDWRTLNWATELIKRYLDNYPVEQFNLLRFDPVKCPYCVRQHRSPIGCIWCNGSGKRDLMVEVTFMLPLFTWKKLGHNSEYVPDEIPVNYTGRIDLPISIDGDVWIMDNKHVSRLGQSFWDEQRMTGQHRGYCWAFEQLTKMSVKGYIVNAVRTTAPPLYVEQGGTFKGKRGDKSQWWKDSFQRERFLAEPWKIAEWKHNTIDLVEEFMWHYTRGFMPQKTKWCSQYGRCPYFGVCTIRPEDRGFMLQSGEFADNNWSPLKQPTQSKQ